MESSVTGNSGETDQLLRRLSQGDRQEWGALLERHRQRLRRMIALRLDQRLQGRIDASDVIQWLSDLRPPREPEEDEEPFLAGAGHGVASDTHVRA